MKKVIVFFIITLFFMSCAQTTEKKIHRWIVKYETSRLSSDEKLDEMKIDSLNYQLTDMNMYYLNYELRLQKQNREYDNDDPTLYSRFIIENNMIRAAMDSIRAMTGNKMPVWRVNYHYDIKTNHGRYQKHAERWFSDRGNIVSTDVRKLVDSVKLQQRIHYVDSIAKKINDAR